jgi:hypothetical protein
MISIDLFLITSNFSGDHYDLDCSYDSSLSAFSLAIGLLVVLYLVMRKR